MKNDNISSVISDFADVPRQYRAGLRYGLPLAWIGRVDRDYLNDELERTLLDLTGMGFNVLETGGQGAGSDLDKVGLVSDNWRNMFKKLLRRCNELGVHVQLSGAMDGQPVGYLEPDSNGMENYRPKRLYATETAKGLSGAIGSLTLNGESITAANELVAVVAVLANNGEIIQSKLLSKEEFSLSVVEIPENERQEPDQNSARIKIELLGDEALKELDMACVMRGIGGAVSDDGESGVFAAPAMPSGAPGGPPDGAPDGAPEGFSPGPGGPGGGVPGYESRAIVKPASHKVTVSYQGHSLDLGDGEWDVIAYYQITNPLETYKPAGSMFAMGGENNPYTIVNCFTAAGAEKVIDTYEKHLFDDEIRALFKENHGGLFYDGGDGDPRCDATTWSEGLPERFMAYTGYDLLPYLPAIYSGYTLPGDGNERIAIEKLKVLSIMYGDFLEKMSDWMASYNGTYHHQAAYSTHLETQEAMGHISVPEVESLNYTDCVGGYIAATSAARLMGHNMVSCEMGATFRNPYDGRLRNLLTEINLALVSGVNQMKLHTSTFRYGENAKWPGCNIHYSSLPDFNDTQPFWSEMPLIAGAINRGQLACRRGVAKRDVLVYLRRFQEPEGNIDDCHHLLRAGYTFDYYNAEMLALLPDAVGRVIGKAGFKAIIVEKDKLRGDGRMPTSAAREILRFARAGVPVIVQGGVPEKTEGLHDSDDALAALWRDIEATGRMRLVSDKEDIPAALAAFDVLPNLMPKSDCGLISWCSDENDVRAYFVLNQGRTYYRAYKNAAPYKGKLSLFGLGSVYKVDVFTGETVAVPYERDGGYACFEADIAPWEAAIYLLGGEETAQGFVKPKQLGKPIEIENWSLQIESWTPAFPYGTSAETPEGVMTKKELLPPLALDGLVPWKDIPGVDESVSGVGYYTSSFSWDGGFDGALLELGKNYDTARVYVNGVEAKVDQLGLRAEIGGLIKTGANTLQVRVPSGLCNVLYSLKALAPESGYSENGLLGPVTVTGWRQ